MEVFKRFAIDEKKRFTTIERLGTTGMPCECVFLPYLMREADKNSLMGIFLLAMRIADNFGEREPLRYTEETETINEDDLYARFEFFNDKIAILSEKQINDSDSNSHVIRLYNEYGDIVLSLEYYFRAEGDGNGLRILYDKTGENYSSLYYRLTELDIYLSGKAGIKSFYDETRVDYSRLPKNFY